MPWGRCGWRFHRPISYQLRSGVPAFGGRLRSSGVGMNGVSMDRSITGCVSALGGGLLSPGVSRPAFGVRTEMVGPTQGP